MPHESFYSTMAQVLPALALVLIFDLRLTLPREEEGFWGSKFRPDSGMLLNEALAVFFVLVGEGICVLALETGHDTHAARQFVTASAFLGLALIGSRGIGVLSRPITVFIWERIHGKGSAAIRPVPRSLGHTLGAVMVALMLLVVVVMLRTLEIV